MRKAALLTAGVVFAALICASGCAKKPEPPPTVDAFALKMFAPLPEAMPAKGGPITEERIALGRMLYFDPRLSKGHNISCNTCHDLARYGVDNEPTSEGHKGQRGDRNSPTVYNAAGHIAQFWDGRAADVEEQAKGPVMNPVEMAMPDEKTVVAVLKSMPAYVDAFKAAFPGVKDPVTFNNMATAIGAFERKLVTPSRWDRFLQGDESVLTAEEKAGFNVFTSVGCQTCHMGAYVGGRLYQRLGVMKPYPDQSDPGRYKVTQQEEDKMMFKVPSLRNVEKTGPYFHHGKVTTLEKAVSEIAEYQLGKQLSAEEVRLIVAWLKTLTGDLPQDYIKPPVLPASTPNTPKPAQAD